MKKCNKCNQEKSETEFNWKNKDRKILQSNCRICQKVMKDNHYKNNKNKYYEKNKDRKSSYRKWFSSIRENLFCKICGENHPAVLDFHHEDPSEKDKNISAMIYRAYDKEKIVAEMKKCVVLCSNCHRKLHFNMKMSPSSRGLG